MGRLSRAVRWWGPIEAACLLLITPFLLFTTPTRALVLLVIPILWGLRRLVLGHFTPRTPADIIIILLMIMGGVGFCVSPNPAWSQLKINALLLGVGFLYATVDLLHGCTRRMQGTYSSPVSDPQGTSRLRWVPAGVIAVSAAFLGLGLLGTRWGFKIPQLSRLVTGLPGRVGILPEGEASFNPNVIGGALLWVLPLNLTILAWTVRQEKHRWGWAAAEGIIAILNLGLLLLTQARGAWLGFAASLLILLIAAGGRLGRVAAFLLLAALLVLVTIRPPALRQVAQIDAQSARILSTVSMEQRIEIWSRAQYAIADFPFTGPGLDAFQHVMPVLYPLFQAPPGAIIPHAHNEFLQVALDLGLPGLIAWQALYIVAFWRSWEVYRHSADSLARTLALGSAAALVAHLGYAMTDCAVLDAKPNVVFWMLVGLVLTLPHIRAAYDA